MPTELTYQFWQVGHGTVAFENAFGDDEPTCQWSATLPTLLADAFQDLLWTLHVVMVEPAGGATRYLATFLDRKVDTPIGNGGVSTLGKRRDDGRNCRERLGIKNGIFRPKEIRDILLEFGEKVNCAVETCWTATSETLFPQSLVRLLFDEFINGETGEVEAGDVHDGLAGTDEFGFGTGWTGDYWKRGEIQTLGGLFKRFRRRDTRRLAATIPKTIPNICGADRVCRGNGSSLPRVTSHVSTKLSCRSGVVSGGMGGLLER